MLSPRTCVVRFTTALCCTAGEAPPNLHTSVRCPGNRCGRFGILEMLWRVRQEQPWCCGLALQAPACKDPRIYSTICAPAYRDAQCRVTKVQSSGCTFGPIWGSGLPLRSTGRPGKRALDPGVGISKHGISMLGRAVRYTITSHGWCKDAGDPA